MQQLTLLSILFISSFSILNASSPEVFNPFASKLNTHTLETKKDSSQATEKPSLVAQWPRYVGWVQEEETFWALLEWDGQEHFVGMQQHLGGFQVLDIQKHQVQVTSKQTQQTQWLPLSEKTQKP